MPIVQCESILPHGSSYWPNVHWVSPEPSHPTGLPALGSAHNKFRLTFYQRSKQRISNPDTRQRITAMTQIPMQSQVITTLIKIAQTERERDIYIKVDNQIKDNRIISLKNSVRKILLISKSDEQGTVFLECPGWTISWLFAALRIIFCNIDPALALQGFSV